MWRSRRINPSLLKSFHRLAPLRAPHLRALATPAGAAPAASRLEVWHDVQREVFAEGFPSKERRRAAVLELQKELLEGKQELLLPPRELLNLLKDTVLCPGFSIELIQRVYQKMLFCAPDAFGGCRQRRQFFRNQALYLYAEQAILVRQSLELLQSSWSSAEVERDLFEFQAVLNTLRRSEATEVKGCEGFSNVSTQSVFCLFCFLNMFQSNLAKISVFFGVYLKLITFMVFL